MRIDAVPRRKSMASHLCTILAQPLKLRCSVGEHRQQTMQRLINSCCPAISVYHQTSWQPCCQDQLPPRLLAQLRPARRCC